MNIVNERFSRKTTGRSEWCFLIIHVNGARLFMIALVNIKTVRTRLFHLKLREFIFPIISRVILEFPILANRVIKDESISIFLVSVYFDEALFLNYNLAQQIDGKQTQKTTCAYSQLHLIEVSHPKTE